MPYYLASILLPDYDRGYLDTVKAAGRIAEKLRLGARVPFGQGVTGQVFETGTALVVPNVKVHDGYVATAPEVRSEIAVPLKRGDVVIGILNVERSEENGFTTEDLDLLTLFASQVAVAIENARLFESQRRRVLEQQTIQSVVQELTSVHDVGSIAGIVDEQLHTLIGFDQCSLFVLAGDGRLMPMTPSPNPSPEISCTKTTKASPVT